MNITLYTIHCPQCKVLQKKLDAANISYSLVDDLEELGKLGYDHFPTLKVEDTEMDFATAVKWINSRG